MHLLWPPVPAAMEAGLRVLWIGLGWELFAAPAARRYHEWLTSVERDQEPSSLAFSASIVTLVYMVWWDIAWDLLHAILVLISNHSHP